MQVYNSKRDVVSNVTQENGRYTIVTNAKDNFWNSDSVTFVYETFEYPYEERSSFTLEATIQELEGCEQQASTGIMIRSSVTDSAANVFLCVRKPAIYATWRSTDGNLTRFQGVNWSDLGGFSLPCSVRLHTVGNIFTAYYRGGEMKEWKRFASGYVELGVNPAYGLAAYSYNTEQTIRTVIDGLSVKVTNYVATADPAPIITDDVLFLENFEEGVLKSYPEGRYSWSRIRSANIEPTIGADGRPTLVWHKDHMNGSHFTGSKHWADYAFSLNLRFDESCSREEKNTFGAYVRHREMDFYGVFHYGIYLTNGNRLEIRKTFTHEAKWAEILLAEREFPYLQDPGCWHNLRIEAFDNHITVFWDREEVLACTDEELSICPVGGVGFLTEDTSVWLDDFTVYELADPLGGAYDNLIGGLWDQPAPADFVYDYEEGANYSLRDFKASDRSDEGASEKSPGESPAEDTERQGKDEEETVKAHPNYRILHTGNVWQSANDIVTIFGDGLGKDVKSLALSRISDERTDQVSYVPRAGYDYICLKERYVRWAEALRQDTAQTSITCPIIQKTRNAFKFRLPADAPDGIYSLRVFYTDDSDETVYLNVPRINFVLGDEGDMATPGGSIRVCGENICPADAPEIPQLCLKSAKQEYILEAVRSEPDNMAEFVLPEDAVCGEYEVTVHNGFGDGRCWSVPKTITVGGSPRESWPTEVFNVKDYGAKGIGCTYNDTPGVILALRAAEANGGGTVLLPRGTYMLTHPITVPEKVRLLGEGIVRSKIIWYPYNWDTDELPDYTIRLKGNVEISGIDFSGTRLGPLFVAGGKESRNIYIHRCRIFLTPYNAGPTDAHPIGNGWQSYQLCGMIRRETNFWTRSNGHITFKFENVTNVQLYDNKIDTQASGGFWLRACKEVYLARNIANSGIFLKESANVLVEYCENMGTGAVEGDNVYYAHNKQGECIENNREAMTSDHGGYFENSDRHYIRSADDAGYEYELPFACVDGSMVGAQVVILEGPGEGQMRRIVANSGRRFTLESPFAIRPVDRDSKMSIMRARSNLLAVSNYMYNAGDFQFYGTQLNSVVARNEFEKVRGLVAHAQAPLYDSTQQNWYISAVNNHFWDANFLHLNGWASDPSTQMCKLRFTANGGGRNMQLCPLIRGNVLEDGFYISVESGEREGAIVGLTVQGNSISEADKAIVSRTGAGCEGMLFADNRVTDSVIDYVLPQKPEFFEAAPETDSPRYLYLE